MSFFAAFIRRQFIHWPSEPTASFAGKTVVVTGANSGLGKEACRLLLQRGATRIVLACRNIERGQAAARELEAGLATSGGSTPRLDVWQLDVASPESIAAFARRAQTDLDRLDAVIANAGVVEFKFQLAASGDEVTVATNVVGPTLLCGLLYPQLRATAARSGGEAHFTIVGSELYETAAFKELAAVETAGRGIFDALNDPSIAKMSDRYNVSKLLVMAAVREMAAATPVSENGVVINSVAPGFCRSDLGNNNLGRVGVALGNVFKRLLARPTAVGARTLVYGAAAGRETHGGYLPDCELTELQGQLKGEKGQRLQKQVWEELRRKIE
ncbi:hypothetical protein HK405_008120, partial [Cladochytrium tenue]